MARPSPARTHTDRPNPRRRAMEIISRALDGNGFAQDLLEVSAARDGFGDADRRLVAEMVYGVIRRKATLDAVLQAMSSRPLDRIEPAALQALRLGAYQLVFMDRVPPHAAVSESVRLTRATGHSGASGFVNAVLRQMLRSGQRSRAPRQPVAHCVPLDTGGWYCWTRPVLPDAANRDAHLAAAYSYPEWIVSRWTARYGEGRAVELMRLMNRPAATHVRANTLRTTPEDLLARLADEGVRAEQDAEGRTLRLPRGANPASTAAFRKGLMQPQDASAAAVAPFLDARPGETVLDLCASPGGKTCHLAELMRNQGRIVAVDVTERKLQRIRDNVSRLGIDVVECVESSGVTYASACGEVFDAVLVDAPCTNTGVLHRRAEARWRLNDRSVAELSVRQDSLLRAGLHAVRPGGRLVYSTCSLEPEENGRMVGTCTAGSEVVLEEEKHVLPSDDGDGLYMARLRKPGPGGEG